MRFAGKTAIVSGGAGGIGSHITRLLVNEGAKVAFSDVLDEAGAKLEAELTEQGKDVFFQRTDAVDSAQVESLVDRAVQTFGKPDVLVNSIGWNKVAMSAHMTEADFDKTLMTHVKGMWLMARHTLPHMMEKGQGSVVNISSMQAKGAIPGRVAYEAAKGGISAMTRALALEYGPAGIRVNAVLPGVIITPRNAKRHENEFNAEEVQLRLECYPLRRLGTPQDIASAAIFLASDDASWITGVDLLVDGGISIQLAEAIHFPPFRKLWQEAIPGA